MVRPPLPTVGGDRDAWGEKLNTAVADLQTTMDTFDPTVQTPGTSMFMGPDGPGWYPDRFNVKAYGAKGDGETDDTAAIKAALADTAVRGGILYFPAGYYLIYEALPVHLRLMVQGEGDVLTEIKQMNPNANCFEGVDIMWLSISNITIDGPESGTGNGIVLTRDQNDATNYIFMDRVTVQHFGNDGISISNCIVSTFNMVHSRENGRHGWNLYGVSGGSAGTSVQLTVCYANENGAAGFLIDTMTYCQFSTCVGEKNGVDWDVRSCYSMNFAACGVEWTIPRGGNYDGVAFRIHQCLGLTFQAPYILLGAKVGFLITGGSSNIMLIAPQEIDPQVGMEASIRVDAGSFATVWDYNVVTPMDLAEFSTTVLTPDGSLKLRNVVEFGMGNNLYALAANSFATDSHFTAWGGVATRVDHDGAPDEEFADGTLVVDEVNERLYIRINEEWHYIDIDDGAGGGGGTAAAWGSIVGTLADQTDLQSALAAKADASALAGKADAAHTHGVADLTATGTKSATTYLRGDNTWATPPNTTYTVASQAEVENAASTTARLVSGQRLSQAVAAHAPVKTADLATKADAEHTHDVDDLNATGTRDGTTFLSGDGSWKTPTGTPGQRGNRWFVSGGPDGFTDYTDVTGMIDGDIFLYPNSSDLFQYDGSTWAYAGTLA